MRACLDLAAAVGADVRGGEEWKRGGGGWWVHFWGLKLEPGHAPPDRRGLSGFQQPAGHARDNHFEGTENKCTHFLSLLPHLTAAQVCADRCSEIQTDTHVVSAWHRLGHAIMQRGSTCHVRWCQLQPSKFIHFLSPPLPHLTAEQVCADRCSEIQTDRHVVSAWHRLGHAIMQRGSTCHVRRGLSSTPKCTHSPPIGTYTAE
jgi:predicted nucleic acid-binding Zn ribbon protein